MHIGLTTEQEKLRDELRAYYDDLLNSEVRQELARSQGIGPTVRRIVKQMGTDGWLGVGWPVEYGGRGLTPAEQFIVYDESMRAGAPMPMLTINTVGPTIMRFGTEEQKSYFLPKIVAGELHFCIGYSEPGAGTDLANLQTRAMRDGDDYIVNGQKLWTSLASDADWCWLAVRTDPEAARHRGISLLLVDMKNTPGITVQPLRLLADHNVCQVFYEDARVPVANRVGEEHGGWGLITNQLNHERVTLVSSGLLQRFLERTVAWAATATDSNGERIIEIPWVRDKLARVDARLEALRLMNWDVAASATTGSLAPHDASAIKVYGTEFNIDALRALMEIVNLSDDEGATELHDAIDRAYRGLLVITFGGGTNELQRDLISTFGLGFPRLR